MNVDLRINFNKQLIAIVLLFTISIPSMFATAGEITVRSGQSSARNAFSKIIESEFSVSTGLKSGYFTYQIGGIVSNGNEIEFLHFPLSELNFPLNVFTVNFDYLMKLSNRWQASFNYETNYTSTSGKMADSDWGVASSLVEGAIDDPNSLDIFSLSRSELNLKDYSLNFSKSQGRYRDQFVFQTWDINLGFGLHVQDYNFEVFDVEQVHPSTGVAKFKFDGQVLIYEYLQITPYLSTQFQTNRKKRLGVSIDFAISPLVRIGDFDNHLLRGKSSDGSTNGWSTKGKISGLWRLTKKIDLFLLLSAQYTKASGWQKQYETASKAPLFKVKLKHFSLQSNFHIGGKFWL